MKNTASVRSEDLRGLKAFKEDYPEAKLIFLYRWNEQKIIQDILCVPVEKYLLELLPVFS